MTPEERAVIEAAEQWYTAERHADGISALCSALYALRESRKPERKWVEHELGIMGPGGTYIWVDGHSAQATRLVLDLLNKADPSGG